MPVTSRVSGKAGRMCRQQFPLLAVTGVVLAILIFHLTQRPVWLGWDPDIALYLMHASNIVDGSPYAATPYIFNPAHAIHPTAYPPGLPLLMAPLVAFFGLDLAPFNALMALCLASFLLVLYFVARRLLSQSAALVVVAVVGLNPFFNMMATMPYSELPFLLAATGGLLLLDTSRSKSGNLRHADVVRAILAGVLVGSAMLIRSVGFLLLPAIALAAFVALIRDGRHSVPGPAIAIAVAITLVVSVSMVMPHDAATYVGYATGMSPADLAAGVREGIRVYLRSLSNDYLGAIRGGWSAGSVPQSLAVALAYGTVLLGGCGLFIAVRERCSSFEMFTALYGAFILLYPIRFEPARYFMPIVPLLVVYATLGFGRLTGRMPALIARSISVASIAAVMALFAASVPRDLSEHEPWPATLGGEGLFAAVEQMTESDAVILSFEPTTLALVTGRRSAIWPNDANAEEFLDYARQIGASYVIPRPPGAPFSDLDFDAVVSAYPERFVTIYADSRYELVRLRGGGDGRL